MRELLQRALDALQIGRECAYEVAQNYHQAMEGYRPKDHQQYDDDVKKIDDAIDAVQKELAKKLD